ncbi:purine nucleoside phosphorylase I, inosine and guanosine-specific [Arthroderma uncinatum]|uniref:purine nucleoside phosphorylase I, inosine and guanosine-specific n=1 Tax=Arthroderma uncinatum TaxID=74035 RepID=UPI00144AEC99|nr:purine nucleoside phosphorylase I, inosine and guanosine-specific [Arthroderma uncinatum]KAF3483586.1 purine nucleoside phosphorylase I, inosine and guanosine-specific [Arthroderma uncinatum]
MAEASVFEQAQVAVEYLRPQLPEPLQKPRIAIICGSGLGGLANTIDAKTKCEFDYGSIPNFPTSSAALLSDALVLQYDMYLVPGHLGKLVFGFMGSDIPAVLMVGRAHFYEGHSMQKITLPVRMFKLLGVETVVVTNACGGLNPDYAVGDVVVLNDHLFLAGVSGAHPLRGPNAEEFGVRFPPLSDAYDLELRRTAHRAWKKVVPAESKRRIHEGVYAFCSGPSFETRAECRMMRMLGADTVGMSTVPEIIVARHCGMRVLALSLVTNNCVLSPAPRGDDRLLQNSTAKELNTIVDEGKANHEEVLETGREAASDMQKLVSQAVVDMFAC